MEEWQWLAMLDEQDGACYICDRPLPDDPKDIAIDHDHSCCPVGRSCRYCRRGLAHYRCNLAIGQFEDSPALMRLAADRLEKAQELTSALLAVKPQQATLL